MKNIFALILMSGLLLAGCAKKATVDEEQATDPVAAVITAEPAPSPVQAVVEEVKKADLKPVEQIFFDFDSFQLTAPSKEALQANALWLKAAPEIRILIEGHTDERGSSTYNLSLGEKRAQAARAFLQSLGITAERIAIISYGQEKPAALGSEEEAWAQNRRAVFVIAN